MELIRAVLNDERRYDRIILLQGKDYPLYSPIRIHEFFEKKHMEEFCHAKNISHSSEPGKYMQICGYWIYDKKKSFFTNLIRKFLGVLNVKIRIKYRRSTFNNKGEFWDIYSGWAQFAITTECAKYILETYDTNNKYNKFMKHRFPPDELYVHTIIHNSIFADRISDYELNERKQPNDKKLGSLNLTYFEYPTCVTVFQDEDDLESLRKTGALFIRKVTLPESKKLLDKIDETSDEKLRV